MMPIRRVRQWSRMMLCGGLLTFLFVATLPLDSIARTEAAGAEWGSDCPGKISRNGNWLSITPPEFTDASGSPDDVSQEVTSVAVSPASSREILVTNGASIMRSPNGGCSWRRVYPAAEENELPLPPVGSLELSITSLQMPAAGKVFALQGCLLAGCREDPAQVGAVVLVSGDGGVTWSKHSEGLPPLGTLSHLSVAPGGEAAYVLVTPRGSQREQSELYGSDDGGKTWEFRASRDTAGVDWQGLGQGWQGNARVSFDPLDPQKLWTGGTHLARSTDGGRTWSRVVDVQVRALDVSRSDGQLEILIASSNFIARSRGGGPFNPIANAPEPVNALARESIDGNLFAVGRSQAFWLPPGPRQTWRGIPGDPREGFGGEIVISRDPGPAFFVIGRRQGADPASIIDVFLPPDAGSQSSSAIDRTVNTIDGGRGCPPPEPPAPWKPGWDPVPEGSGPVYVTDFSSGSVIQYDDHGTGTVVGMAPPFTEGTALDPLGRIIASTRFSDIVTRVDPLNCSLVAIDRFLPTNEGPTFDVRGNLFVVDTNGARIVEYPWPQFPGQRPRLIYDMNRHTGTEGNFMEDARIAPPGSPFAGDIFVLYSNSVETFAGRFAAIPTVGNPDKVARLTRTEDGWQRERDFFELRSHQGGFTAVGMAFQPDGHLLVPEFGGSGEILRIRPDGLAADVFAVVGPSSDGSTSGRESLVKMDIDAQGYVYVTATAESCAGGGVPRGSGSRLVRFAPDGTRLVPDFTHNSRGRCFVGISVPHHFEVDPLVPPVPVPPIEREWLPPGESELNRGAGLFPPPPPPPPPPVIPVAVPGLAPALGTAQAPVQSVASQANAQAQAAAVAQRQEQPQMAFVHAARQAQDQLGMQNAMVRTSSRRDPLAAVKVGLGAGAFSLITLWGLALSMARSIRVAEVRNRKRKSPPRTWRG